MTGAPSRAPAFAPALRTIGLGFRRALRGGVLGALCGCAAAFAIALAAPPVDEDLAAAAAEDGGGALAAAPWLHVPAFAATFFALALAVDAWPAFARELPGSQALARLVRGPLQGCGLVAAGALLALALPLGALGAVWPLLPFVSVPAPRAHRVLQAEGDGWLDDLRGPVRFDAGGFAATELLLQPLGLLEVGATARVTVRADGEDLSTFAAEPGPGSVRVRFAARTVQNLELHRAGGELPLLFPEGGVTLVGAEARGPAANGAIALLCYLAPAFTAMALACLIGPFASLPVVLALLAGALLVQTLGGAGPTNGAVDALLRGRWLPAAPEFRDCLSSLAVGALAMIVAMPLRAGVRR